MRMLSRAPRALFLLALVALQIGCDQATKELAESELKQQGPIVMFGGLFRFIYAENPGAFLGMGGTLPEGARFWIFTVLVGLGLVGGLLYLLVRRDLDWTTLLAGAFLVAGGIGNFIDRAFHDGLVIDFMQVGLGSVKTGIFNVADLQIVGAAALLAVLAFRAQPDEQTPAAGSTPPQEVGRLAAAAATDAASGPGQTTDR